MRATQIALLQGPSLRLGFCCPEPSTLNRPHPLHSRAQHNFLAQRVICTAFAVRERLGDPRAVPGSRVPGSIPGALTKRYFEFMIGAERPWKSLRTLCGPPATQRHGPATRMVLSVNAARRDRLTAPIEALELPPAGGNQLQAPSKRRGCPCSVLGGAANLQMSQKARRGAKAAPTA